MKRLIIVGNGFDLAHGMETSYSHFIKNYLSKIVNTFYKENSYSDRYINVKFKFSSHVNDKKIKPIEPKDALIKFKEIQQNSNCDVIISSYILRQIISLDPESLN